MEGISESGSLIKVGASNSIWATVYWKYCVININTKNKYAYALSKLNFKCILNLKGFHRCNFLSSYDPGTWLWIVLKNEIKAHRCICMPSGEKLSHVVNFIPLSKFMFVYYYQRVMFICVVRRQSLCVCVIYMHRRILTAIPKSEKPHCWRYDYKLRIWMLLLFIHRVKRSWNPTIHIYLLHSKLCTA